MTGPVDLNQVLAGVSSSDHYFLLLLSLNEGAGGMFNARSVPAGCRLMDTGDSGARVGLVMIWIEANQRARVSQSDLDRGHV